MNLTIAISCSLVAVVALIALGWRICMMAHEYARRRLRDVQDRYVTKKEVDKLLTGHEE